MHPPVEIFDRPKTAIKQAQELVALAGMHQRTGECKAARRVPVTVAQPTSFGCSTAVIMLPEGPDTLAIITGKHRDRPIDRAYRMHQLRRAQVFQRAPSLRLEKHRQCGRVITPLNRAIDCYIRRPQVPG